MMLETVHEVFAGMIMPAFMTFIEIHQQNIRGEIGDGEPRDKCSMPSFDTFLFFQKHLAIKNTLMINGVHYSEVSTATYQGSPGTFLEGQRTICPVVKPQL